MTWDVCIIGAGVVGAAIARELSRYSLKILWLEKGEDVAVGSTKANSAIVHGGYTAKHGTVKGELCIRGNRMYDRLDEELHFGLKRTGSLVLAFSEDERRVLEGLIKNGEKNGVRGLRIVERDELEELEPAIGPEARAALYCNETAVTSPYEFCIALAENAVTGGVDLRLHSEVVGIRKTGGRFHVTAGVVGGGIEEFEVFFVINAAGVYADKVSALAGDRGFTISPRRGQYLVFRRGYGSLVNHVIFQAPTEKGKGILVTPTYWGNLLIGPDAEDVASRENVGTDIERLKYILRTARRSVPSADHTKIIRSFSGLRPSSDRGDFIIEESTVVPGFIQAAGIESPGLTSSPAIAERVVELLEQADLSLEERDDFQGRRPITVPGPLQPFSEIAKDVDLPPGEGERIICRCEQVREKVILDALYRGIPIDSTDAMKRRTRAGMGACQGSFCTDRVRALISRETGLPEESIGVRGSGSGLLPERVSPEDLRRLGV